MRPAFWEQVVASGFAVPDGRPLDELTAELATMLGSPDPRLREELATETLTAWIRSGTYDELMVGLADGMAAGLVVGLGEDGTDTVFRRAASACLLGACLRRVAELGPAYAEPTLRWGDELVSWFVRERDLRDHVRGKGRAAALTHGAGAVAALAAAPSMGELELVAVLDVLGDRVTAQTPYLWDHRHADQVAAAAMAVLRRDRVETEIVEGWLERLADVAGERDEHGESTTAAHNTEMFLRAFHLQLILASPPPAARGDLLLAALTVLKRSDPAFSP